MTDKERKKAQDRLCGKTPRIIILLMTTMVIELIVFLVLVSLTIWLAMEDSPPPATVVVLVLYAAFLVYFYDLVAGYYAHCRILKQQFEFLPQWKQEKLLNLAHSYGKSKNIYTKDHYIYGMIREQRHGRKKSVYPVAFRYLEPSEIIWAHIIENQTMVSNSMTHMAPTSTVHSDYWIRLYLLDGRYVQGTYTQDAVQKIFALLKEQNPSCKLGYKKEWKEWLKERS